MNLYSKKDKPNRLVLFAVKGLFLDNQCHKHQIFRFGRVGDAVFFTVRAEGGGAGANGYFFAVVVVEGGAGKDVVSLRVAVVFMHPDGAEGRDDDLGVHIALAVEFLWCQEFHDGDGALTICFVGCLNRIRFNKSHVKVCY